MSYTVWDMKVTIEAGMVTVELGDEVMCIRGIGGSNPNLSVSGWTDGKEESASFVLKLVDDTNTELVIYNGERDEEA